MKKNYEIPPENMLKIKNLLDKYNIILDLFIINASGDIQKQYSEILSEKSIFKMYNTVDQDPFLIAQSIIDEIFDIYSINLIIESNSKINDEPKNDDKVEEENHNEEKTIKRKRVTASDAKAIYNLYDSKDDTLSKELCNSLGYSVSTYYNIIAKKGQITEKYKKPNRVKKWDDDDLQFAINSIGQNPVLTLEEIIDKTIHETNASKIVNSTLSSYLKDQLITLKSVRLDPVARNTEENKESRKKYCNLILSHLDDVTYVFIDEMCFSCCTQRNRGRSFKGTDCVLKGPLLKAPNVSVCMAVSKEDGVIYHSVQNNAFNAETFAQFIKDLIEKCKQLHHEKICFVMDNVRMHKTEQSIKEQCSKNYIDILFLPKYSPELNPIEKVFFCFESSH